MGDALALPDEETHSFQKGSPLLSSPSTMGANKRGVLLKCTAAKPNIFGNENKMSHVVDMNIFKSPTPLAFELFCCVVLREQICVFYL